MSPDEVADGGWGVETMRSLKRSSALAAAKINNEMWSLGDLAPPTSLYAVSDA